MRDVEIRRELKSQLSELCADNTDTIVVEEFGLRGGAVRADMALVNGCLKGYEIKSDSDTLKRLERQSAIYSKVFDTVSLIVEERHLDRSMKVVPSWWGVHVAERQPDGTAQIRPVRIERENSDVLAAELVQLLWRNEVLGLLRGYAQNGDYARKPRRFLWEALASSVPLPELKAIVRKSLKLRVGWRLDSGQISDDVKSQPSAMSSNSLSQPGHLRIRRYTHRPN